METRCEKEEYLDLHDPLVVSPELEQVAKAISQCHSELRAQVEEKTSKAFKKGNRELLGVQVHQDGAKARLEGILGDVRIRS